MQGSQKCIDGGNRQLRRVEGEAILILEKTEAQALGGTKHEKAWIVVCPWVMTNGIQLTTAMKIHGIVVAK